MNAGYGTFKKILCILALFFGGLVSSATAEVSGTDFYNGHEVIRNRVILRTRDNSAGLLRRVGSRHPGLTLRPVSQALRLHTVQSSDGVRDLMDRLQPDADIEYVEPDYVLTATATPNDAKFAQLWGMSKIEAPKAWDIVTGSSTTAVAIIDSGIDYAHPDLAGNVWTAPSAYSVLVQGQTYNCPAGSHGFNVIARTCDPADDNMHGTHIAGTISAVGNNGIGVAGVAWRAKLVPIKFLDSSGRGLLSDAIAAIDVAIQLKAVLGASSVPVSLRVLTASWGGGPFSQSFADELAKVRSNDLLFVTAAGNSGANNDQVPFYPASYSLSNVITVAQSDSNDALAGTSNYGATTVHLTAPGTAIVSTIPGGGYTALSGSSMAVPHVVGAAVLVLAACPKLTTAQLKSTLLSTVDVVPELSGRVAVGGRLNAGKAVAACLAASPPPIATDSAVTFVGMDSETKGTWIGTYGSQGAYIVRNTPALPSWMTVTAQGEATWVWALQTSDSRGLQLSPPEQRIAAVWYGETFNVDLKFTDSSPHQISVYCTDWDSTARRQRIEVLDLKSLSVLDSQLISSSFNSGIYLLWNVKGSVRLRFSRIAGANALVNGIFVDPPGLGLPSVNGAKPLVTGYSSSTLRNDHSGWVGMKFTVGSTPLSVKALGRFHVSGNGGVHRLKLFAATDGAAVPGGSVDVGLSLEAPDLMVFAQLPTPARLRANTAYYLVSQEMAGADQWNDAVQVAARSDVSIDGPVLSDGSSWSLMPVPRSSYVPVSLLYSLETSTPPTVSITSPTDAATVSGSNVTVLATAAADAGLSISNVKFTLDGDDFGRSTTVAPYTVVLDTTKLTNGKHTLSATATDSSGASATSPTVSVTIRNPTPPPTVSISAPGASATISGVAAAATATATAVPGLSVVSVQFLIDGNNLGPAVTTAPYTIVFDSTKIADGSHVLAAVATDSAGASGTSTGVTVIIRNQPVSNNTSAAFVKLDSSTGGSWIGKYGMQGQAIINDPIALPAFARINSTGTSKWVWSVSTTDLRALQHASDPLSRVAAVWYGMKFNVSLTLTDGNAHQVALYCVDFDTSERQQTVEVLDAITGAVIDSRRLTNFSGGTYMIWKITGSVQFRFTSTAGRNALLNGMFLDSIVAATGTTAAFVKADVGTSGSWMGAYGSQGQYVVNDKPSLPAWVKISPAAQSTYVWSDATTDTRALQHAATPSSRVAAVWYGTRFTVDVSLTDGQMHQVAIYCTDYDTNERRQIVEVIDSGTGAVLDTRNIANFSGGTYLVWNVAGAITLRFVSTAGRNAVVNGLFIDPVGGGSGMLASFVGTDAATHGTWIGAYGASGRWIVGELASLPPWASVSPPEGSSWVWSTATTDVRALQHSATPSSRVAAVWYGASFAVDVAFSDLRVHRVAVYCADFDTTERQQRVDVVSMQNGTALDTQTLAGFNSGVWLVWNVIGSVRFQFSRLAGRNALVNGIFFD